MTCIFGVLVSMVWNVSFDGCSKCAVPTTGDATPRLRLRKSRVRRRPHFEGPNSLVTTLPLRTTNTHPLPQRTPHSPHRRAELIPPFFHPLRHPLIPPPPHLHRLTKHCQPSRRPAPRWTTYYPTHCGHGPRLDSCQTASPFSPIIPHTERTTS